MTHRLLLIKHSVPAFDHDLPAAQWLLSEEGQQRCAPLAQQLAMYAPQVVVSSLEPKATETGQRVAAELDVPIVTFANLHEHERPQAGLLSRQDFETAVADFFAQPEALVFGLETAFQAQQRFEKAITEILECYPDQTVAVVAHGRVITLFLAQKLRLEPFPLWKRLGLPSFVALQLPDFKLEEIMEKIGD
jgi:broad specificity phosphatase PhoE